MMAWSAKSALVVAASLTLALVVAVAILDHNQGDRSVTAGASSAVAGGAGDRGTDGEPRKGPARVPVDKNGRAKSGRLNLPGNPSYGPHPRDENGDGIISGEGAEAYPDFMPVYLADGSTALVETKYLLGVDENGDPLTAVLDVPAYSPDGDQVGTYTINEGGVASDDPGGGGPRTGG